MKQAKNKPSQSTKQYGRQLCGRSRITNGKELLPSIDGRSIWARRLRDLISLHTRDLGGFDNLSQAQLSLIRRAAALTVELEHLEEKFQVNGSATPDQLKIYQMATNTLRRLFETIGLERRPRDITPPHPFDYAKDFAARRKAAAEETDAT